MIGKLGGIEDWLMEVVGFVVVVGRGRIMMGFRVLGC
jgi:hypothetical protein